MTRKGWIGLGLGLLGLGAAGAVIYYDKKSATAATTAAKAPVVIAKAPGAGAVGIPAAPPAPPIVLHTNPLTWNRVTTVTRGATVRVSMSVANVTALAASAGARTPGVDWNAIINAIGTQVQFWYPDTLVMGLPTDWPSDDPDAPNEYHAQFVSNATFVVAQSALLSTAMFWTLS
jgi:hypothetical protein